MRALFAKLARDEAGFIVSAELVLVGSITVLTMVVGLAEVSYAVNSEMGDVANAFDAVNQSYSYRDGQNDWSYTENDGDYDATEIALSGPVAE